MKIVLAPDSYKGSLTAVEVADAMACGVKSVMPDADIVKVPLADGGEGTASVLCDALGGIMVSCETRDPLGRVIVAEYCVSNNLAVIETAAASGLLLVNEEDRDAMHASSYGTGLLIKDALDRGCCDFLICLGGSATTDAGCGILYALGVRFWDNDANEIVPCGENLAKIKRIDMSHLDERLKGCKITAACDVENVLYGENGAAYVFSPQKGANLGNVVELDEGLRNFAQLINSELGFDVANIKGGGAAGGIGAMLVSCLSAELCRGVEVVLNALRFDELIADVDLIMTGEGRTDRQTLMGKLPMGVLRRVKNAEKKVALVSGAVESEAEILDAGFNFVKNTTPKCVTLSEAMRQDVAYKNVIEAVGELLLKM